jgi:hypothetical protein
MAGGEPKMEEINKSQDLVVVTVIIFGGLFYDKSWDSAVGIATGYGLNDGGVGVRVPIGSRIFPTSSSPALGHTQPPIQ